jgi:hypothetical protein
VDGVWSFPKETPVGHNKDEISSLRKKKMATTLDRGMNPFIRFLLGRTPLLEVSDFLPREAMNSLFTRQIDEILPRITDSRLKTDLLAFREMDFVGYLDRALKNADIPDADLDQGVHDLVVYLLITPGSLFQKWNRQYEISFRFKKAVRNYTITTAKKYRRRRLLAGELPSDLQAPRPVCSNNLICDFRSLLELKHGSAAARVFDWRLEDRDIKPLIGTEGIPTSYALKQIVQKIKALAVTWSRSDPMWHRQVEQMMDQERTTVNRRFGRKATSSASLLHANASVVHRS